jgi:hypothetical protein
MSSCNAVFIYDLSFKNVLIWDVMLVLVVVEKRQDGRQDVMVYHMHRKL